MVAGQNPPMIRRVMVARPLSADPPPKTKFPPPFDCPGVRVWYAPASLLSAAPSRQIVVDPDGTVGEKVPLTAITVAIVAWVHFRKKWRKRPERP